MRQSLKRQLRNKSVESEVKTVVTRARKAVAAGDAGPAKEAVTAAISALDKAAEKGIIHANSAARRKSRLAIKLNAMSKPADEKPKEKKKKA
jgi:small subunit ribosomal protein S20